MYHPSRISSPPLELFGPRVLVVTRCLARCPKNVLRSPVSTVCKYSAHLDRRVSITHGGTPDQQKCQQRSHVGQLLTGPQPIVLAEPRPDYLRHLQLTQPKGICLAHDQHFTNIVAGKKEFDGSEVAEEGLDVAVIEYALQLEAIRDCGVDSSRGAAPRFPAQHNPLHLEGVGADDVEAVARRVRTGIASVE